MAMIITKTTDLVNRKRQVFIMLYPPLLLALFVVQLGFDCVERCPLCVFAPCLCFVLILAGIFLI